MSKELILLKAVKHLGKAGDIVKVSPGYGKNYLIPKKLAVISNKENKLEVEKKSAMLKAESNKLIAKAKDGIKLFSNKYYEIIRNTMHDGRLYGSLSAKDLAKVVNTDSFPIKSNNIILSDIIKTEGVHKIKIELYPDIFCNDVFIVVGSSKDNIRSMIDKYKSSLLKTEKNNLSNNNSVDNSTK